MAANLAAAGFELKTRQILSAAAGHSLGEQDFTSLIELLEAVAATRL